MTSNTTRIADPPTLTPLYDELAATYGTETNTAPRAIAPLSETQAPVPKQRARIANSHSNVDLPAVVLDLFARMKAVEAREGYWNGGDIVDVLGEWFSQLGIDIEADEAAAAQALSLSARLAAALTTPALVESDLVIHIRTARISPLDAARPYLAALVRGLGQETSAAVFDHVGDQIAHIVHPSTP